MINGLPVFSATFSTKCHTPGDDPAVRPFSSYPKRKVGHHQNLPLSSGHVFCHKNGEELLGVVEISGDLTKGPKNQPSWNPLLQ